MNTSQIKIVTKNNRKIVLHEIYIREANNQFRFILILLLIYKVIKLPTLNSHAGEDILPSPPLL